MITSGELHAQSAIAELVTNETNHIHTKIYAPELLFQAIEHAYDYDKGVVHTTTLGSNDYAADTALQVANSYLGGIKIEDAHISTDLIFQDRAKQPQIVTDLELEYLTQTLHALVPEITLVVATPRLIVSYGGVEFTVEFKYTFNHGKSRLEVTINSEALVYISNHRDIISYDQVNLDPERVTDLLTKQAQFTEVFIQAVLLTRNQSEQTFQVDFYPELTELEQYDPGLIWSMSPAHQATYLRQFNGRSPFKYNSKNAYHHFIRRSIDDGPREELLAKVFELGKLTPSEESRILIMNRDDYEVQLNIPLRLRTQVIEILINQAKEIDHIYEWKVANRPNPVDEEGQPTSIFVIYLSHDAQNNAKESLLDDIKLIEELILRPVLSEMEEREQSLVELTRYSSTIGTSLQPAGLISWSNGSSRFKDYLISTHGPVIAGLYYNTEDNYATPTLANTDATIKAVNQVTSDLNGMRTSKTLPTSTELEQVSYLPRSLFSLYRFITDSDSAAAYSFNHFAELHDPKTDKGSSLNKAVLRTIIILVMLLNHVPAEISRAAATRLKIEFIQFIQLLNQINQTELAHSILELISTLTV